MTMHDDPFVRTARFMHQGRVLNGRWQDTELVCADGEVVSASAVTFLPPVEPRMILGVGRNYRAHAAELGNTPPERPLFFLKTPSSLIGHGAAIEIPLEAGRVDYEGELVIVIGRLARNLASLEDARSVILGYTIGNDVTARELQKTDGQWTRAKGFDTFGPIGPVLVHSRHPADWEIVTTVNGTIRQRGRISDMIFSPEELVMAASRFTTLMPGDVIFSGTPEGVGPLQPGDRVDVRVEGIGTLSNLVKIRD